MNDTLDTTSDNITKLNEGQILVIVITVSGVLSGLLCITKSCYHSYRSPRPSSPVVTVDCETPPLSSIANSDRHRNRRATYCVSGTAKPAFNPNRRGSCQPPTQKLNVQQYNGTRRLSLQPGLGTRLPTQPQARLV